SRTGGAARAPRRQRAAGLAGGRTQLDGEPRAGHRGATEPGGAAVRLGGGAAHAPALQRLPITAGAGAPTLLVGQPANRPRRPAGAGSAAGVGSGRQPQPHRDGPPRHRASSPSAGGAAGQAGLTGRARSAAKDFLPRALNFSRPDSSTKASQVNTNTSDLFSLGERKSMQGLSKYPSRAPFARCRLSLALGCALALSGG